MNQPHYSHSEQPHGEHDPSAYPDGYQENQEEFFDGPPPPPPAKKKHPLMAWWDKVGGGSLTLSIIVHAIFIFAAFLYVINVINQEKKVDFLPGGSSSGNKASKDLANKVENKRKTNIKSTVPLSKITSKNANATIALPDSPPAPLDTPNMDMASMSVGSTMGAVGHTGGGGGTGGGGFGDGNGVGRGMGNGQAMSNFISLPPSMKARCSPQERLEKLRQNGGNVACETAVLKALAWLKTKQNADGSWGTTHKTGMSGMALLCYLGHCETEDSVAYGDNVMKCVTYLIGVSQKNNGFISENLTAISNIYEHGIACYGLGEQYSLLKLGNKQIPGMREAFEKGVKIIIENQLPDGGWGYAGGKGGYRNTGAGDISVTGWQYQALKAAKHTNLKIPKLETAIKKVDDFLVGRQNPKTGGFGTENRAGAYNQWTMTGVSVLGLQTLSQGKTKHINEGIEFLSKEYKNDPPDYTKNAALYVWYYNQQAFFQKGGDSWRAWNEPVQKGLVENQRPDGSWKPERGTDHGQSSMAGADAEIFRACVCTLMLEVFYRYLKVGGKEEGSIFDFSPK